MSLACLGLVVECQGGALNSLTARNAEKEAEQEKEAKTDTSEVEVSGRTSKARKLCGQAQGLLRRSWHEREVRKERRVGKVSKCARYRKGSVES